MDKKEAAKLLWDLDKVTLEDVMELDFSERKQNHKLRYKELQPELKQDINLQVLALIVDFESFEDFPEQCKTQQHLEKIIYGVENYGISLSPKKYRSEYYEHESGLDKEDLLDEYLDIRKSDSELKSLNSMDWAIEEYHYKVIENLFKNKEVNNSQYLIFYSLKTITENPIEIIGTIFSNISSQLLDNEYFVLEVLRNYQRYTTIPMFYASERIRKNKEVVLTAVRYNFNNLDYADDSLKKDKEIVLEAVKQHGEAPYYFKQIESALQHADDSLKKDKEIVLIAVKNSSRELQYADDTLKNDPEILAIIDEIKE